MQHGARISTDFNRRKLALGDGGAEYGREGYGYDGGAGCGRKSVASSQTFVDFKIMSKCINT